MVAEEFTATMTDDACDDTVTPHTAEHSAVDSNGSSHCPMTQLPAMQQMPPCFMIEEYDDSVDVPEAEDSPSDPVEEAPDSRDADEAWLAPEFCEEAPSLLSVLPHASLEAGG